MQRLSRNRGQAGLPERRGDLLRDTALIRRLLTLGAGEAASRVLYLLAFVALARALGKTALGQFGLAVSLSAYLVLVVQQGFDQIAIRAVSRDRGLLQTYVRGLFGLRLTIAAVLYSALTIYQRVRGAATPEDGLLLILGLTCFTTAIAPRWAVQLLSPRKFAIAAIISQSIFCVGALFVALGKGVYWAAVFSVLGDSVSAVYLLTAIRPNSPLAPSWCPPFWREITQQSWPLSLSALLGILIYNFDVLALGWLASTAAVGLYLACYRCATVFSPLLSTLQMSILPAYAEAYPDTGLLWLGMRKVVVPSALAAIAVAILFSLFPSQLLSLIYGGNYVEGASILRVLVWSLPLQAVRSILRQVLFAAHLQHLDSFNMFLAAATAVIVDLCLIPRLGPLACAFSTVASEAVLLAASAIVLKRMVFTNRVRASKLINGER